MLLKPYFSSFCVLLLFWTVGSAFGQVRLLVIDQSGDYPVPYAKVTNKEGVTQYTNQKGEAIFANPSAKYKVSCTGYVSVWVSSIELEYNSFKIYLEESFVELREVVIQSDLESYRIHEGIRQKEVIDTKDDVSLSASTAPEVLEKSGLVYVQRSQMGGGSPVIRGFEANRILLLVDGVRMNNAIFRGGHLQNSVMIDPMGLEGIDLIFGPGSLSYGSDALGGTVNFKTLNSPYTSDTFQTQLVARFSSAELERTLAAQVSAQSENRVLDIAIRLTEFGDLRSGKQSNFIDDFRWERPEYVARIAGRDTVLQNNRSHIQKQSAYAQGDVLVKYKFKANKELEVVNTLQASFSTDVPRYDRLANYDLSLEPEFAEWNYGPQNRLLAYQTYRFSKKRTWYDFAILTPSFQFFEESRRTRRFKNDLRGTRTERIFMPGLTASFYKSLGGLGELQFGSDVYYNRVTSKATQLNIVTGDESGLSTRYPSTGSDWVTTGYYLNHSKELGAFTFHQGLRFDYIATAFALDSAFSQIGFDRVQQQNIALSGGLGLIYNPFKEWQLSGSFQSAFRAPNLDDVSKVFDSNPGEVVVPNVDLQAERTYSLELISELKLLKKLSLKTGANLTRINGLISVQPSSFLGSDSVFYDGLLSRVTSNQNIENGTVRSFFVNLDYQMTPRTLLSVRHTDTRGILSNGENMPHIAPAFGRFLWQQNDVFKFLNFTFLARYNLKKPASEFSNTSVDRLDFATPEGTPAYVVFDVLIQKKFKNLALTGGIKNLLDTHYRTFASGINGAGRSFYMLLNVNLYAGQ